MAVAGAALLGGSALIVAGVYVLAGAGWALIAAAPPFLVFGAVLARGLTRG